MTAIKHIETALQEIDDGVQTILIDTALPLDRKDDLMLPLVQQKKILKQTLEDLIYLKEHPPTKQGGCGMGRYRED